jgi:hypothetical protein
MARHRKTQAERRAEWDNARRQAWEQFYPKLEAVQSYEDAQRLVDEAPRPDTPGRPYYSNLGFFVMSFRPPDGANAVELREYARILGLLNEQGRIKAGLGEGLIAEMERAAAERPWTA